MPSQQEVEERPPAFSGLLLPHPKLHITIGKGSALDFHRAAHCDRVDLPCFGPVHKDVQMNSMACETLFILENRVGLDVTRVGCFAVSFDSRAMDYLCSGLGLGCMVLPRVCGAHTPHCGRGVMTSPGSVLCC